ncbi:MAG: helix-turn-helix domain-containing protein [Deltaproteobacteria bacterium]|nr:helix-turn-helix domain-containing protein [Deltaproteobacteria bacterium]
MTEIPHIQFRKRDRAISDFASFTLSSLYSRRNRLDHALENHHRIDFYTILLITKGSGIHQIDFQPYPYRKGDVIFISKTQIHAFDACFNGEGIAVLFTEPFLVKNVIHSDILFFHRLFNYHLHSPVIHRDEQGRDNLSRIMNDMYEEYHSPESFAKEEILRSYLKLLLLKAERIKGTLITKKEKNTAWIDVFTRFKTLIEDHHTETRNAGDYAEKLNLSYKHLNEICKNVTGHTAKGFIDTYLILEIKRQLSISDLSIKELTYQLGFDEPTNFLKFFKKHTSQTPTQFRQNLKK